jgi:hypothetical protein
MPNENEVEDLELEDAEDAPEIEEGEEDTTDYKALAIKNAGIAKRNKTKLEKLKLKNAERKGAEKAIEKQNNKQGFDYAEKAFLKASDIKPDEYALVEEAMKATGKDLESVLDSKWFQAELKEQREAKVSKDAVPSGTKRSSSSARDTVDYWIAKGELPPADQRELRTKVVNAKIKAANGGSPFGSN